MDMLDQTGSWQGKVEGGKQASGAVAGFGRDRIGRVEELVPEKMCGFAGFAGSDAIEDAGARLSGNVI